VAESESKSVGFREWSAWLVGPGVVVASWLPSVRAWLEKVAPWLSWLVAKVELPWIVIVIVGVMSPAIAFVAGKRYQERRANLAKSVAIEPQATTGQDWEPSTLQLQVLKIIYDQDPEVRPEVVEQFANGLKATKREVQLAIGELERHEWITLRVNNNFSRVLSLEEPGMRYVKRMFNL